MRTPYAQQDALMRLQAFLDELRLARATDLALSGRLLEAEGLLTLAGQAVSAREIDLLARIAAQQGHYDQAEALWEQVIEQDPSKPDYQTCIEAVYATRHRISLIRKIVLGGILLLIATSTVAVSIRLWQSRKHTQFNPPKPQHSQQQSNAHPEKLSGSISK